MTANEILKEVLKDPILRTKYNIYEEEIDSVSFDTKSNHQIIEVIKEFIQQKKNNSSGDNQVYRNIKSIHFGIKE